MLWLSELQQARSGGLMHRDDTVSKDLLVKDDGNPLKVVSKRETDRLINR